MKLSAFLLSIFISLIFSTPVFAKTLDDANQKVCTRFEEDVTRLAAIMEEVKRREGVTETRVAFGNVDTPIETADYWINFAAEAVAFQRIQKYSSANSLKGNLGVLKNKILRAKEEVRKVLE